MNSQETKSSLAAFDSALIRLGDALDQPKTEWTRDAAIQRFEFTIELAWKTIMRFARREGVECSSPRQAFRTALKLGWVKDEGVWLDMLDDRNRTSHTYSEVTAEDIFSHLPGYESALSKLIDVLKQIEATSEPDDENKSESDA